MNILYNNIIIIIGYIERETIHEYNTDPLIMSTILI